MRTWLRKRLLGVLLQVWLDDKRHCGIIYIDDCQYHGLLDRGLVLTCNHCVLEVHLWRKSPTVVLDCCPLLTSWLRLPPLLQYWYAWLQRYKLQMYTVTECWTEYWPFGHWHIDLLRILTFWAFLCILAVFEEVLGWNPPAISGNTDWKITERLHNTLSPSCVIRGWM